MIISPILSKVDVLEGVARSNFCLSTINTNFEMNFRLLAQKVREHTLDKSKDSGSNPLRPKHKR